MPRWTSLLLPVALLVLSARADAPAGKLLFEDDFTKGSERWKPTDPKAWKVIDTKEGKAYSQFTQSKYKPKVRSPFNYSLVKDLVVSDFVLQAKVQSTARDYPHRDMCLFFGWQGPEKFYYVHLAKKADDHANQVFLVNDKPRVKISKTTTAGTNWTDGWHQVKVVRRVKEGTIEVYFDDMKKPVMTAEDRTFTWGQVGFGSFDDTGNWREVKVHGVKVERPPSSAQGEARPRARDLGVPFVGTTGSLNAITDVKGVEVGHATLITGKGKLVVGTGPVRTGVTAILPRGRGSSDSVFAGWFWLNGNGEMTGTAWVEESGFLEGPVMLTNTTSVGTVRDGTVKWLAKNVKGQQDWALPVIAETYDGFLNDTLGFHIKEKHVFEALESARSGAVAEGNVGGGTGMTCFEFKGGIGTASRKLGEKQGGYTVGVLVQANFGLRHQLQIAGVPVGREITEGKIRRKEQGSIIIVVATDAPLLPHQLKRLARRASLGLARTGSISGNGSGDLFLAFSTANPGAARKDGVVQVRMLPHERLDPLFEATVLATEEAIVNSLVAARTMVGRDDHKAIELPHERLKEVLKKYNRLGKPAGGK